MGLITRELWFALRERTVQVTLLVALFSAAVAVVSGLKTVGDQQQLIEKLKTETAAERALAVAAQVDPGGTAYYGFHFTYAPPSALAFAALGTRDTLAWKHRVRMLALEGQLYEADTGNPELSLSGKLDFAFVVAVLAPLLLIFLLHDSEAGERRSNRHELLRVTAPEGRKLYTVRAALRAALLWLALVIPFAAAALLAGAPGSGIAVVLGAAAFSVAFWLLLCRLVVSRITTGPACAAGLLGLWLVLTVVVPASGKLLARAKVEVPSGGELLLAQREAVNDAWDLPKQDTMDPFIERHPEWAPYRSIERPFEWKWYYAFQQVGDQVVEELSRAIREGVAQRDLMMARLAWVSPPLLVERWMTGAAATDVPSFQAYEACVRSYHAQLRAYYYPLLFEATPFSEEAKALVPEFEPCAREGSA